MAWAFGTFVLSGVCIISVGFLSIYSIRRERRYLWAIIAMALAVVSFFLGGSLMDLAMRLRGFTLEP
jgi:drug/metabolite transporter superfamily protein YnfA